MLEIKVCRCSDTARIPTKAHSTDACFDLYADLGEEESIAINAGMATTIKTGIKTSIPNGYFAAVFCRSGMGIKRHLRLSNSVGIIDSDYRGEWLVQLRNDGLETQIIKNGDRIAQFAVLPVIPVYMDEVRNLDDTERSSGGFGSTGN